MSTSLPVNKQQRSIPLLPPRSQPIQIQNPNLHEASITPPIHLSLHPTTRDSSHSTTVLLLVCLHPSLPQHHHLLPNLHLPLPTRTPTSLLHLGPRTILSRTPQQTPPASVSLPLFHSPVSYGAPVVQVLSLISGWVDEKGPGHWREGGSDAPSKRVLVDSRVGRSFGRG